MLKVKISGYYKSGKENVDFNTEVTMPECANNKVLSNVQNRVLHRVFKDAERPFGSAGKCWVDDVKKDDKEPTFIGKNLKELSWDEIQEVAIAYDLNKVPLYRTCSLREARVSAYKEYCNNVKGKDFEDDYDYANAPDICIGEKKVVFNKKAKTETKVEVEEEGQIAE